MPNGAKLKTREEIKKLIEELSKNIETLKKEIEKQRGIYITSSNEEYNKLNGEYNQLKEHFDGFFTELKGMWNSATTTDPLINTQVVQKLNFFIDDKDKCYNGNKDKIIEAFGKAREELNTTEKKLNTAEDKILDFLLDYRGIIKDLVNKCIDEFQGKIDDDKKLAEAEIKIDKVSKPIKFGEIASECVRKLIENHETNIVNAISEDLGQDRIIDQLRMQKVIEG